MNNVAIKLVAISGLLTSAYCVAFCPCRTLTACHRPEFWGGIAVAAAVVLLGESSIYLK